jgi:hypothetical protein
MMHAISQEILKTAPWGLVWRVGTGAGLSILDLGSDINVIVLYLNSETKRTYGIALLVLVLLNFFLQCAMATIQHKMSKRDFLRELLLIFTGLKPGFDAYRAASDFEMQAHHVLDAKQELMFTKCIELMTESVPGCVLQSFVYVQIVNAGESSPQALTSILISALTAGFTGASVSCVLERAKRTRASEANASERSECERSECERSERECARSERERERSECKESCAY